jgi:hypothetical protein
MRYSYNDVERCRGLSNPHGGFNWAGIFGCDITAVADCTFHVNCLNAKDTPVWTGSGLPFPIGTVFSCNSGGAGVPLGALPLFVQY